MTFPGQPMLFNVVDFEMPEGIRLPQDVAPTYTYTTAKVLHPTDEYNVTNMWVKINK